MWFANCLLAGVMYELMRNTVGAVTKTYVMGGIVPALLMVWACARFFGRPEDADWSQPGVVERKRTDP